MASTSTILPFGQSGSTTTGDTLTDAAYSSDSQRTIGNQLGPARRELVNKALTQATSAAAGVAQFIVANATGSNTVADSLTPAAFSSLMSNAVTALGTLAVTNSAPALITSQINTQVPPMITSAINNIDVTTPVNNAIAANANLQAAINRSQYTYTTVSATSTVVLGQAGWATFQCSPSANMTISIPAPSFAGQTVYVFNTSTYSVTVSPTSYLNSGGQSLVLQQGGYLMLMGMTQNGQWLLLTSEPRQGPVNNLSSIQAATSLTVAQAAKPAVYVCTSSTAGSYNVGIPTLATQDVGSIQTFINTSNVAAIFSLTTSGYTGTWPINLNPGQTVSIMWSGNSWVSMGGVGTSRQNGGVVWVNQLASTASWSARQVTLPGSAADTYNVHVILVGGGGGGGGSSGATMTATSGAVPSGGGGGCGAPWFEGIIPMAGGTVITYSAGVGGAPGAGATTSTASGAQGASGIGGTTLTTSPETGSNRSYIYFNTGSTTTYIGCGPTTSPVPNFGGTGGYSPNGMFGNMGTSAMGFNFGGPGAYPSTSGISIANMPSGATYATTDFQYGGIGGDGLNQVVCTNMSTGGLAVVCKPGVGGDGGPSYFGRSQPPMSVFRAVTTSATSGTVIIASGSVQPSQGATAYSPGAGGYGGTAQWTLANGNNYTIATGVPGMQGGPGFVLITW